MSDDVSFSTDPSKRCDPKKAPEPGLGEVLPVLELKRPVTKSELARWLNFTPRFIDAEVKKGNLRKLFSGRGSRFSQEDIKAWFERRSSEAAK